MHFSDQIVLTVTLHGVIVALDKSELLGVHGNILIVTNTPNSLLVVKTVNGPQVAQQTKTFLSHLDRHLCSNQLKKRVHQIRKVIVRQYHKTSILDDLVQTSQS